MAKRKRIKRKETPKKPAPTKQEKALSDKQATTCPDSHPNRHIHCIFLFLLAFGIYSNTLNHGYVLDDSLFITGNSFTQKGFDGIREIWTNDAFVGAHGREFELEGGRYRPLSISIFAIVYEFFGLDPFPGHLLNVLLFGLSGVMLYLLLLKLMPDSNEWIPLTAAAIFVVHPIHTEVVANIKSLDEILSTLFLMLTILFLFKDGKKNYLLSAGFFLLALLSKESSITGLAIIPFTMYFFSNKNLKTIAKRSIPYITVAILYILLREQFSGGFGKGHEAVNLMDSPYLALSGADRLATITYVCGRYLMLLFFPHPLSWDYSYHQIPDTSWADMGAIISLLVYAGLIYYVIRSIKKNKKNLIAYGIIFYLCSYSIASNFLINIGTTMGERFIYLSSVGFCIALAGALLALLKTDLKGKFTYKAKWLLPLIIIVPLGVYGTFSRNKAWKSNFTLYETDAKTVPNSARSRMFYGVELHKKYDKTKDKTLLTKGIRELEESVKIYDRFYHAYMALGTAHIANNDYQSAAKAFNRVLEIEPQHINAHFQLGISYARGFSDFAKAILLMEKGIAVGYDAPDRYSGMGNVYGMAGMFGKALNEYLQGLQKKPNDAQLHLNIAITYDYMGKQTSAKSYYEKAFALDPSLRK